jgi:hypothetical protein
MISLEQVIEKMETGEIFSISFVTHDKIRKTGGQLITLEKARKVGFKGEKAERFTQNKKGVKVLRKNPHHFSHFTKNIQDMKTRKVIKIHCRLIVSFNGERMRY